MVVLKTYNFTFAAQEESQHFSIPGNRVSDNSREVTFQITASCFHKFLAESTCILLVWQWRKSNARKPPCQRSVEKDEVGKSSMYC